MGDQGQNTVETTSGWIAPKGANPFTHFISGRAHMGNTYFNMPIITHVIDKLYQGGYVEGIDLADHFDVIVSLYPWEKYPTNGVRHEFEMYDGYDVDEKTVIKAASAAIEALEAGKSVLIHCQAGLNRSALVAAYVLIAKYGYSPKEAIIHLRANRSNAVLCNETFERWLKTL